MKKGISGFTLIELVTVIIILGILAAVAIPKFIDLSSDAKASSATGVAAALSSANSINYISRKENPSKGVSVHNCTDLTGALQGGLPANYTITSAEVAPDATVNCTLNGLGGATATFTATGIN